LYINTQHLKHLNVFLDKKSTVTIWKQQILIASLITDTEIFELYIGARFHSISFYYCVLDNARSFLIPLHYILVGVMKVRIFRIHRYKYVFLKQEVTGPDKWIRNNTVES
jgi:hypothetical protein